MHKIGSALAASVIGLAATQPAMAGFEPGSSNIQFGASAVHTQGTDDGNISADVSYGYFLTQGIELGVLQGLNWQIIDDADDIWSASTVGFANYNFGGPDSTFVPFIGAFAGAVYNEDDATGTLGPQAGAKAFINDTTFALIRYRYEWFIEDLENGDLDDNSSDGNHVVTVGLGLKF